MIAKKKHCSPETIGFRPFLLFQEVLFSNFALCSVSCIISCYEFPYLLLRLKSQLLADRRGLLLLSLISPGFLIRGNILRVCMGWLCFF